jgi:hypothetical protein
MIIPCAICIRADNVLFVIDASCNRIPWGSEWIVDGGISAVAIYESVISRGVGVSPDDLARVVDAGGIGQRSQGVIKGGVDAVLVEEALTSYGADDVSPTIWPALLMPLATITSLAVGPLSVV